MEGGHRFKPRGDVLGYSHLTARPLANRAFLAVQCAGEAPLGPFQRSQTFA
jgi:hypothetical protein